MPRRQSYEAGTPNWIDLSTTDVEAAKAFYGGLFGWTFEDSSGPDGEFIYAMASKDGENVAGIGELSAEMQEQGVPPMWNMYFAVENVDEAIKKAVAAGGSAIMEAMDVFDAGRMAFVMDDQGAGAGLWQAREHKGCGLVNAPGAFTWSELYAPDTKAATSFYAAALGLGNEAVDMGGGEPYTMFSVGERGVAGTMHPPMEGVPSHWHVYLGAANTKDTAARATELGGQVVAGPLDTPVGEMATIADPQGAAFSVIQLNEWPE